MMYKILSECCFDFAAYNAFMEHKKRLYGVTSFKWKDYLIK